MDVPGPGRVAGTSSGDPAYYIGYPAMASSERALSLGGGGVGETRSPGPLSPATASVALTSDAIHYFKIFLKLRKNSDYINSPFKAYNSVGFSIFRMSCNHHHYLAPEHFHRPEKKPCTC